MSTPMSKLTLCVFCCLAVAGASMIVSAVQLDATALARGARADRTIAADDIHTYRIALAQGEAMHATAVSDVAGRQLRVLTPAGEAVRDMTLGIQGGGVRPDTITVVADRAGDYHLEIRAPARSSAGKYTLTLVDVRPATDDDRLRADAERSYWDAESAFAKRDAASLRRALELFHESLPRWQKLGDQWFEGNVLAEIGGAHRLLAQNDEALEYYTRALPLLRATGNLREQTGTLNNIASVSYSRGEVRRAFDYFSQALEVARVSGDRQAQSILLNNMGTLYQAQGEHQAALDLLTQALALRRAVQDRAGEVRTLNNLSLEYRLLGDSVTSKQTAEQAVTLAEQLQDRQLRAASLNSLGTIERLLGDLPAAERHLEQALTLFREFGERRLASATLNNLGELHQAQGRVDLARKEFEQALAEARAAEERQREAYTLRNLGGLEMASNRPVQALTHFEASLDIERAIRNQEGEAESLREIARALNRQGQIDQALARSEAALDIVESLRSKVGNPQLRTTYFSSKRSFYELYVDLLMSGGSPASPGGSPPAPARLAAALEASERARARSLLDMLRESGVAIREGVDRDLLEREESLRQRINVVASSRNRALADRSAPDRLAPIERELDDLFREYQQTQADIRARSPHYAAISQADAVRVGEIQRALDPDTLLLEYMLGDERSYLWAVTPTSLTGFRLPGRARIEDLARDIYTGLTRRSGVDAAAGARGELSRLLLGPVAAQLQKKRLVIVADGALLYVPFTVLDSPVSPVRTPLIVDHEVVHLPSVSSLLVMRGTPPRRRAEATVGIIADPVFAADDVRVTGRAAALNAAARNDVTATRALDRAAADSRLARFPRLRFTRQEAEGIAALLPPGRRFAAFDFAATRETAASEAFGRHQILHFATHGLINSVHPELSGLVFSLVDARGQPQDGFLRLHDVYNLKLDAELVVLSACQTALGQDIRGEGLIGLTRGFMYAGAPRVVASLWDVEDRATAELMKRFYEGMLARKQTPARALRDAQLALIRDRRWSNPYYWGAFVLQGEWQQN